MKIKLRTKIMLYTVTLILSAIIFVMSFFYKWAVDDLTVKISRQNLNMAINIGKSPYLGDILEEGDPEGLIQNYTFNLLKDMQDIDMFVVANMEGKRFSHPKADRLGGYFVGGDEKRVIENGDNYVSIEMGTLGKSLRAFAPVVNSKGEQVGFIMVGTLVDGIERTQRVTLVNLLIYSLGGLILGVIGAYFLSGNIKQSLLGLEPHQISMMYTERNSMLEALQEGIIAIGKDRKITMINESACRILGIPNKNSTGQLIYNVFPNNDLEEVLNSGIARLGVENNLNGVLVVTNTVPIIDKGEVIGAIASFRDKTELVQLGEELTGFREVLESLRASSHEHQNKLHVILGLIQIGQIDLAKEYILESTDEQQKLVIKLMKEINNPVITGLLISKISRAKELGVELKFNRLSKLDTNNDRGKDIALVIILGNLIENALEASARSNKAYKEVVLLIEDVEASKRIVVWDNGPGIEKANMKLIFNQGFSTNSKGRGYGLKLVKDKVASLSGRISVKSELGIGTKFEVVFPKEELLNDKSSNS